MFVAMPHYNNIYVTFKITLKCNLRCQYCYGRDNASSAKEMSEDEIRRGLEFVADYASSVGARSLTICWHGGEPFLMASRLPSIMDYANSLFLAKGISVKYGVQTNATLLTPSTFDMIRQYMDGHVGVSLDLYSNYRTFASGELSTRIAVNNIDRALKAGLTCGAINLITHDNINHIDEIYDFYHQRNMNVRLPRVFPIDMKDVETSNMYVSDEEYANAMIRFFDRWASDSHPAPNTDIVKLVADLLLGVPSLCLREEGCHKRYMALSPGGDIFSCAEFDTPDSVIGNFLKQTPAEFIASDTRERIAAHAPVPEECHSCKYEPTCHGGCFRERYMLGFPYRCKGNILYWNHIVKWLESKGGALYILKGKPSDEKRRIIDKILK